MILGPCASARDQPRARRFIVTCQEDVVHSPRRDVLRAHIIDARRSAEAERRAVRTARRSRCPSRDRPPADDDRGPFGCSRTFICARELRLVLDFQHGLMGALRGESEARRDAAGFITNDGGLNGFEPVFESRSRFRQFGRAVA
jgi:hypothetical protein